MTYVSDETLRRWSGILIALAALALLVRETLAIALEVLPL